MIGYVLKPVSEMEFNAAVKKPRTDEPVPPHPCYRRRPAGIARFAAKPAERAQAPAAYDERIVLADSDDLIRCEATDNYTVLYFAKSGEKMVLRTLATFEEELKAYGFICIHHKHLINIRQVTEYHKGKSGSGYVIMKDKALLEVSVRKSS
ncbi:LytR/AlgR family response regulator transcription factor [Taibaiella helva]|uniref:LytR/AlgR family response regulator transcription factor n=1 Tax=Taibaiella helva TaxID=2301235 RepID=UPI000E56E49E|nr:LytTR family DNA-binding domain-containing protein [Taibaiella helva]